MKTIVIVDDEKKIRDVLHSYFEKDGFHVLEAENGKEALSMLNSQRVDMLILDLMLPDVPGEKVCEQARAVSSVPILMLTAKSSLPNRITGLSVGADDYVTKPFDPAEVVARVRAILRRTAPNELLAERIRFHLGHLEIDSLKHEVYRYGEKIKLTPNEYGLLVLLAKYPQRYFSREELVIRLLGHDFPGDTRTIDQHVKNLRQKIEKDPKSPQYILTVYGSGYRFGGGETG